MNTSSAPQIDSELFGGAPLLRLYRRCGLLRPGPNVVRRGLIAVCIAWLPLAILTLFEGEFFASRNAQSFLPDIAVHARFLMALPLLVIAETLLASRLRDIVQHFVDVAIVRAEDRAGFRALAAATGRRVNSWPAELIAIGLSYAIVAALVFSLPLQDLPRWHQATAGTGHLSLAGWWHALVSLPLLLIAVFGLLWRWWLWTQLLWRIAKMDLALVPAHPDGFAGLGFASYSVRACSPYALAVGLVFAGALANRVIYEHASVSAYGYTIVGVLLIVLVLFNAPLLVFTPTLLAAWRRGIFEYGALAERVGRQFELQWFGRGNEVDAGALSRQDFSATTDLYSVVSNVYRMRLFVYDLQGVLLLLCATAAPFIPVMLLAVPLETILTRVAEVLL